MKTLIIRAAAIALAAALVPATGVATTAGAVAAKPPAAPIDADTAGLAARGYDVTAYFTAGKPVLGSSKHQLQHNGALFRFASAEALAKFKADPAAYSPRFGGYCAWAVSQGYVAPGDPQQWAIVDGRLYLNFNARAKALWDSDRPAAIIRGNANWPRVLTHNQDS